MPSLLRDAERDIDLKVVDASIEDHNDEEKHSGYTEMKVKVKGIEG